MLSARKLRVIKQRRGTPRSVWITSALAIALLAAGCGGGAISAVSTPGPTPQPAASLSPRALDFGNTAVGASAPAQPVSLQNNGSAALAINTILASGDYTVTHNCGSSLAPSAACTLNVTFTPSSAGTRSGTLQLTDNASNSPQAVTLTGTGIVEHLVTLSWTLSTTSTVIGYFAYRSAQPGGPYTLLNNTPTPATATSFQGYVPGGQTWYFVVTAVDADLIESVPSNEVAKAVPP